MKKIIIAILLIVCFWEFTFAIKRVCDKVYISQGKIIDSIFFNKIEEIISSDLKPYLRNHRYIYLSFCKYSSDSSTKIVKIEDNENISNGMFICIYAKDSAWNEPLFVKLGQKYYFFSQKLDWLYKRTNDKLLFTIKVDLQHNLIGVIEYNNGSLSFIEKDSDVYFLLTE